jgi:hypothetical protein
MKTEVLRRTTNIEPTGENAGLQLTVVLKAYDNGQVYIDGVPMNGEHPEMAWASAIAVYAEKVRELQQHVRARLAG